MVTDAASMSSRPAGSGSGRCSWCSGSHFGPDASAEDVVKAAVVVELTHVASLYHDDVMDEAGLRRGSASANARWGNTVAILVGDFLFARASDIVSELGPEFVRLQARTFSRLVQGQIAETVGPAGAGPARPLPASRRGQDRVADRHLGALRGQAAGRAARGAADAGRVRRSRSASSSSSATTSSTSPATRPAKPRAPTCGKASPRCPRCWPAARRTLLMPGCWSCWTPICTMTRPWPRRCACSVGTAASIRRATRSADVPSPPAPFSIRCPTVLPATLWKSSATPLSRARPSSV